jgi:hypothetical protein
MPRIPYITDEEAGPPELVEAIRKRRGGRLAELDRLLLYSTPFATGWGLMMGRVRTELSLSPLLREIGMLGVAVLNGAEYTTASPFSMPAARPRSSRPCASCRQSRLRSSTPPSARRCNSPSR